MKNIAILYIFKIFGECELSAYLWKLVVSKIQKKENGMNKKLKIGCLREIPIYTNTRNPTYFENLPDLAFDIFYYGNFYETNQPTTIHLMINFSNISFDENGAL